MSVMDPSHTNQATFGVGVSETLLRRGVAVIPTDTVYGLVARAEDEKAVKKVYALKGRDEKKPCIVLIGSLFDLEKFGITLDKKIGHFLSKEWPAPLSVILPCPDETFSYLHRGTKEIAFRMPAVSGLRELISTVGPLVAPSANPQGQESARIIEEAKNYFGDKVDVYVDGGILNGPPSTLVRFEEGKVIVLREGVWRQCA